MAIIGGILMIGVVIAIMHGSNGNAVPGLIAGGIGVLMFLGAIIDHIIK